MVVLWLVCTLYITELKLNSFFFRDIFTKTAKNLLIKYLLFEEDFLKFMTMGDALSGIFERENYLNSIE